MDTLRPENLLIPEYNLDNLKISLLQIIDQYNSDPANRKLEPINNFGEKSGELRLFWVNWNDDNRSTHMVGFMYNGKENALTPVGSQEKVSFENAADNFKEQIADIPKK